MRRQTDGEDDAPAARWPPGTATIRAPTRPPSHRHAPPPLTNAAISVSLRARERRVRGIAMDIAEWLRRLELPQYIPAFAENAIDWAVLPRLTADDLPEQSREMLRLVAVERMSYREISAVLGIDEKVVSSRIDRARQQLRNALGERDRRETKKKKVTAEERGRIIERLSALRNASAVAREFRRNPNVTQRIARQAGIELTAGYAIRGYRGSGAERRLAPSGP